MRILIVAHYAPPHIGGIEGLVDRELRMFADAGHEVRLVTSACGKGEPPQYPDAVEVVRVPAWNVLEDFAGIPYPLFSPSILWVLWKQVGWCDVVRAHGFVNAITTSAFLFGKMRRGRRRLVLIEHAGPAWFNRAWIRGLQAFGIATVGRLNVRLSDVCCVFHLRVSSAVKRLSSPDADVRLMIYPVNAQMFRPASASERTEARRKLGWDDRPKALFVGRLIRRKGLDLLLQAQDPAYDLVVCGPGHLSEFAEFDLTKARFLPPRPQAELADLYRAADLLVAPSRSEGNLAMVAQEALSCGTPALLGIDPGLEPYSGCAGLHFCELTPADIRRRIREILEARAAAAELVGAPLSDFVPTEEEWTRRAATL